jgi:hypothetical protein
LFWSVGAQADRTGKLRGGGPTGIEEIFLTQVAEVSAKFARKVWMVVDDQAHIGLAQDGENFFGETADSVGRFAFGSKLNQVRTAFAKLSRYCRRRPTAKVSLVNKRIEAALA